MRLSISKSKNAINYYVVDSHREGKKIITEVALKIGTHKELLDKGIENPEEYCKEYVKNLNLELKQEIENYVEKIDFKEELPSNGLASNSTIKNIGWLFPIQIYNQLGIDEFVNSIDTRAKFDIKNILKYISISRILKPASKKSTYENSKNYLCSPEYNLINSYRLLEILSENNELLQKILFQNTQKIVNLNTDVFYYDCSNFYFETEKEDDDLYDEDGDIIQWGLRKYGYSKEHRPNPIIQMGLFIDSNGIPISYTLNPGTTNEQVTAIPLEKQMIKNYKTSDFIYCSDAGLGSYDIRFFNSLNNRHYVVTQSLKKTSEENADLIFKDLNWKFVENDEKVSLKTFKDTIDKKLQGIELTDDEENLLKKDMIYKEYPNKKEVPLNFIKDLGIKLSGKLEMEETIYITFSQKFYIYQKRIFSNQLERAEDIIKNNKSIKRNKKTDPARLIDSIHIDSNGEIIEKSKKILNKKVISSEENFHGFYALATNLDKNIKEILEINAQRWRIEQNFRILKTDFDARPAYVWTDPSIRGHFAICYIALLIYRILERKLIETNSEYQFSSKNIITTLNNMNVIEKGEKLYQSAYTGSEILDALNNSFNLSLNKKHYKKVKLEELFK